MLKNHDNNTKLLLDLSNKGRRAFTLPECDVPSQEITDKDNLISNINLPEVSQLDLVRYFTNLSQKNFSIDTNFYPLGSCTMKYNPKVNDQIASLDGFSGIHPYQPEETVQGAIELLYDLQKLLGKVTGLEGVSLSPLAGAQGEYSGLLIARMFHESNGDSKRNIALVPDSAHGTNPASAKMAGLEVVTVKSDEEGNIDIENLKELANEKTAVFMITIPSTLGIFEPNILEITKIIHENGGLVYADGANLNALLGLVKLSDLGVDICHSNLHKTFSTPHGGGGPGSGPVMVNSKLKKFLPYPVAEKNNNDYNLIKPENSIGTINGFYGSFLIAVRAYSYIRSLGKNGIKSISENAIINANYIQSQLKDFYEVFSDRYCMHETVISAKKQKKNGISALDIAKRLLDYGVHAPTMYFPLIVEEALMIEPTESETKETLDNFISIMLKIHDEVTNSPEVVKNAPHNVFHKRLDEALAARNPILKWKK
ncbi:MAG: glycine dehydrogenase (aminomethyl-transferring) [Chloroflexi bacterium]|nr:glycine dehydrogenase (aminomethyl-transferring) [Chloroflexota bacterium]|tara:strand:- start:767 stop:2218 length:1452 start_codon:yes stop_codon:yes gene_type:complete